jgi:hypothetical protein
MRNPTGITSAIVLLVVVTGGCAPEADVQPEAPNLTGPYIGQTPPGDVPEIFAPDYLPDIGWEHTATMFTADGTEAFWGRIINPGQSPRVHVIMHARQKNGVWLEPELAPFNVGINSFIDSVSPDGKRVFFQAAEHTVKDGEEVRRWTNWVAHKSENGWEEPRLLEETFSWPEKYFDYHETNSGNRYFTTTLQGVEREIGFYRSRFADGTYEEPQALGPTINSEYLDYGFYIDPDERFILFASTRPGNYDGTELFISFRRDDDSWGPARNLATVNAAFEGGTWPYISPDGRYLFFLASVEPYDRSNVEEGTYAELKAIAQSVENGYLKVYWVDTSFIDDLQAENS